MTGLEFTSTLIGQLISWPVAVFGGVLALRKPLCELLPRLKSYEGVAGKFSFGDRLAETEESVDRAVSVIDNEASSKGLEPPEQMQAETNEFTTLLREAETNPSYLILAAWERLAGALDDLVGVTFGTTSQAGRRDYLMQLRVLQKHNLIDDQFIHAMRDLRDLRNRVAHGRHNPTSGEAIAYVGSANELAKAMRVLANRLI